MSNTMRDAVLGGGMVEVVRSAHAVGLLDAVEVPGSSAELAQRLDLEERAVELTLEVLRSMGYVERSGAVYRLPEQLHASMEELASLEPFLRTGAVPAYLDQPEQRGQYYADSVEGLGAAFLGSARQLAASLGPADRIVDVGAGSAIWSLTMVEAHGGQVIAIDHPDVLPNASRTARTLGLEAHLTPRPGDYFEVAADRADRVVLANVVHLEAPANAARLIAHQAASLVPGGELVVVDVLGGPSFEAGLFSAVYQLHLGMRTAHGRAWSADQLGAWAVQAGLAVREVVRLAPAGLGAVVCVRPEVDDHAPE